MKPSEILRSALEDGYMWYGDCVPPETDPNLFHKNPGHLVDDGYRSLSHACIIVATRDNGKAYRTKPMAEAQAVESANRLAREAIVEKLLGFYGGFTVPMRHMEVLLGRHEYNEMLAKKVKGVTAFDAIYMVEVVIGYLILAQLEKEGR